MTLTDHIDALMATNPTIRYVDEVFSWEKPATRDELRTMVGLPGADITHRVEVDGMFFYSPQPAASPRVNTPPQ